MNAPFEPAHSVFGGSVAARVLRCPASVDLTQKVPAYLRKTSAYADRGTALHAAITLLLDDNELLSFDSLVGRTIGSYTLTDDDIECALRPVFAYVDALLTSPGAEFYLECRVVFPYIANTFGTADLIVRIGRTIHVIDLKFGVGVRVLALTPDGDGDEDIINTQLLFYAAAARHSLPEFFAGVESVVLTILQPVSIEPDAEMVSSVAVTHAELDEFVTVYRAEALSDAPRLQSGSWCRFCPARPICPAHTGPLLDLAQFAAPTATPPSTDAENAAFAALQSAGFYYDDVMKAEMRSPKQVELRAKARGLEIPKELIGSRRSGVLLVRSENVRAPVLGRGELARRFSEALKALQGGGQA